MVADQVLLVKDSAVSTNKAPFGELDHVTLIVLNGKTDVEDFTVVGHI